MTDPIVVIGGGIAGICCIQQLAEQLPDRSILLVTSSNLVKVMNNIEKFGLNLVRFDVEDQPLEQFKTNYPNVRVIIDKVIALDATTKRVLLKSAEFTKYDRLVICTGASPKPLECKISDEQLDQYCCLIRDTETVRDLEKKFTKSKRVCIVGNGGIATELVFSIRSCQLIWVMRDAHITSTFLDAGAAHFLRSFVSKDQSKEQASGTASTTGTSSTKSEETKKSESQSTLPSDKVVKRLKYTIVEGECRDLVGYGSALGPDWQQKFELKGELQGDESTKNILLEKNCELRALLRYEELSEEQRSSLSGEELFRYENGSERWPVFVQLTNDKVVGCDLLINAIGVRPNSLAVEPTVESAVGLQLASDGGILVDQFMRTSLPDVYAAGDVCTPFTNHVQVDRWLNTIVEQHFEHNRIHTDHWHQIRLWTQARQMGVFVANSIALHERNEPTANLTLYSCFDLFTHMTCFFGFKVILIGLFNGQHLADRYEMLVRVEEHQQYVKVIVRDGRLKGAILIGDTDLEETFENLIVNQLDISDIQESLLESTVDLEDYFD